MEHDGVMCNPTWSEVNWYLKALIPRICQWFEAYFNSSIQREQQNGALKMYK